MSTTEVTRNRDDVDALVAAATAGDEVAFAELADRYRPELHAHCLRTLRSVEDAEDAVQETFLRAWRWRAGFRGRSSFRAWLYRIATNACLDMIRRRPHHHQITEEPEGAWALLEAIPTTDPEPDTAVVSKETLELAFTAAVEHLPPKQHAVLILRGVLGLSAKDTASLLEASVASVNSALQRARQTMKHRLPEGRLEWTGATDRSEAESALLQRYVEAIERADVDAFVEMLHDKTELTTPPERPRLGTRNVA
jgi:RNA polymerase sigma-70 factor (ECF subfamily)